VPADAGSRRERHESERLGRGRVDGLANVDAELSRDDGQLVDECDVDVSERVFEELGELGRSR
jgi:hypothetical protein